MSHGSAFDSETHFIDFTCAIHFVYHFFYNNLNESDTHNYVKCYVTFLTVHGAALGRGVITCNVCIKQLPVHRFEKTGFKLTFHLHLHPMHLSHLGNTFYRHGLYTDGRPSTADGELDEQSWTSLVC